MKYSNDLRGRVIFISHQWCGNHHPDPDGEQLRCLQTSLSRMMSGAVKTVDTNWKQKLGFGDSPYVTRAEMLAALPHMFIWMDYMVRLQLRVHPRISGWT